MGVARLFGEGRLGRPDVKEQEHLLAVPQFRVEAFRASDLRFRL